MRGLNLDQLRTFVEVLDLGNFSAAARRLNLSQPAVSLHIRELEQHFGVRLIERMGRQAHATAPGRELLAHAGKIFRACDDGYTSMRRFSDGWVGRVHISTTLTALMYELPSILRRIRSDYPGIELVVTNMPTRDSIENVLSNAVDLALVTLPVKSAFLRITPLRPEMLVAIFSTDTKNIPDVVTPSYFARQPLVLEHARGAVHALVIQWLEGELPLSREPMLFGTIEAVKKAVASGLGVSVVPDVAVNEPSPDIVVRPLRPQVPCTLALIEHRNKPDDPALEVVRNGLLTLKSTYLPTTTPLSHAIRAG